MLSNNILWVHSAILIGVLLVLVVLILFSIRGHRSLLAAHQAIESISVTVNGQSTALRAESEELRGEIRRLNEAFDVTTPKKGAGVTLDTHTGKVGTSATQG